MKGTIQLSGVTTVFPWASILPGLSPEEFKRLPHDCHWQVTTMLNPKSVLTTTLCFGLLSVLNQSVQLSSRAELPELAQAVPKQQYQPPQGDAERLGVQEVDLSSLETKPTLPRHLEDLRIHGQPKVILAPGQAKPEQVTADTDRGIQVQVTP